MDRSRGIAFCGLACCACSEEECVGCKNDGCKDRQECKCYNCCKEKGYKGCGECPEFPCDNEMLNKLRVRTFAKIIAEVGEEKLMDTLEANDINGIKYHFKGLKTGDYDSHKTEAGITAKVNIKNT